MLQSHPPDIYQWNISSHFLRASSVSRVREEAWQVLSEVRLAADKTAKSGVFEIGWWSEARCIGSWEIGHQTTRQEKRKRHKTNILSQRTAGHVLEPRNNATLYYNVDQTCLSPQSRIGWICRDQIEVSLRSACSQYWLQIYDFSNYWNQYQPVTKWCTFNFKRNIWTHAIPTSDILVFSVDDFILNCEKMCSSTMQISSESHIITTYNPPRMELKRFDVRQRNCHFRRCNVSRLRKRPKDGNVLSSWQIFELCWVCAGSMQSYACSCSIVIDIVYPKLVDSEFSIAVFGSRMDDSKDWYHWLQWSWNCAKICRNWHAFWRLCAKHGG